MSQHGSENRKLKGHKTRSPACSPGAHRPGFHPSASPPPLILESASLSKKGSGVREGAGTLPGCPERRAGAAKARGVGGVQRCASQRGRQGADHTACSPSRGSGFAGASPPPLRAACGRTWPLRTRGSRGRSLSPLPAGGSPASPHPPLSPSLPSLPILGFSIISQCDGHLSRSPGLSLCVRGVGRPHCFSCSCVPARLASPARGLPGSGSLSPELCLGLCSSRPPPASASGFPPCLCASVSPGDRRSPSWSPRLWSSSWSLAESPSLPGFSSSRAEPRGSAKPSPCQVTVKSPCDPKAPRIPRRNRASARSPRAVPWGALGPPPSTHTHTHTRAVDGVQLQLHCAKGAQKGAGLEIRKQTLARAGTWENLSAPCGSEWPPRPLGDPKRGSG